MLDTIFGGFLFDFLKSKNFFGVVANFEWIYFRGTAAVFKFLLGLLKSGRDLLV